MPLSPTSWNKANRVKWTLGTFASKAFAHYGYGPWCSKIFQTSQNQRISWQLNTLFLLTGCPLSKHLEMSTKNTYFFLKAKTPGNFRVILFWYKNPNQKNGEQLIFSAHGSHEVHKCPENRFATLRPTCLWGGVHLTWENMESMVCSKGTSKEDSLSSIDMSLINICQNAPIDTLPGHIGLNSPILAFWQFLCWVGRFAEFTILNCSKYFF